MESIDFLIQSYAVCIVLLYLLYFVTQMLAPDINAHPKEDQNILRKEIEKSAKIADDATAQEEVGSFTLHSKCHTKLSRLTRWKITSALLKSPGAAKEEVLHQQSRKYSN
jgi:hypothetical protein